MKVGDMLLAVNTDSFMKMTYDEVSTLGSFVSKLHPVFYLKEVEGFIKT